MFYVYSYVSGLKTSDVLSYVLFFAHQCNTTVLIMQGMIDILRAGTKRNQNVSLYSRLCEACEKYNKNMNGKDVGSVGGQFACFQVSNNEKYSEDTVTRHCTTLNFLLAEASTELKSKS